MNDMSEYVILFFTIDGHSLFYAVSREVCQGFWGDFWQVIPNNIPNHYVNFAMRWGTASKGVSSRRTAPKRGSLMATC